MLGTLHPASQHREVTVVGAGVAGLLAAHALDKAGYEVTLIEASNRAGGLIRTVRTDWGSAESAAHSLLATPAVRALCEELGIELVPVREDSRARYVFRKGRMRRFPLSPWEAMGALARAYFVLADSTLPSERMTLDQWASRFLGTPARDALLAPFLRGIYGAMPAELTVGAAFPSLAVPRGHSFLSFMVSRLFGGKRGPRQAKPMMAPRDGMGSLVEALDTRLAARLGNRYRKGERLTRLPDAAEAANLVLAVPAAAAAELLEPIEPALARALRAIQYTPLVSTTVFARGSAFRKAPRGVGVLVARGEGLKSLGVLFNSSAFPGRTRDESDLVSLTMMLGGTTDPRWISATDGEIDEAIAHDLGALFGLERAGIVHRELFRWPQAVPQYNAATEEAWRAARESWCSSPGRILFGNYTGQVSVRGMIDAASGLAGGLHRNA